MKINSINSINLNTFNNKTNSYQQKPSFNNTFAFSKTSSQALRNQILFGAKRRSDNPNRNIFCQDYEGNVVNVKVKDYERDVARYENDAPFSGIMHILDNGILINAKYENGLIESAWKNGKLFRKYGAFDIVTPNSLMQGSREKSIPYKNHRALEIKTPDNQYINKLSRQEALKIVEFDEEGNAVSTRVESRYLNGALKRIWTCGNHEIIATDYSPKGNILAQTAYDDRNTIKFAKIYDEQGTLRKRIYKTKGEYTEEVYNKEGRLEKAKVGGVYNIEFPELTQSQKLNMEYPNTLELYNQEGALAYLVRTVRKNKYADDLYVSDVRNNREVILKNVLYNNSCPQSILNEPQIVAFNFDETKPDKQLVFFDDTTIIGDEIYSDELEEIIRILDRASKAIKEDDMDISKEQVDWFKEQLGKKFQIRHYSA